MIVRVESRSRWVVMSKVGIESSQLSFKATGILAYLLSKPDNWQANERQLAKAKRDKVSAIRAGLKELETAGYMKRTRTQLPDGRFTWECVIYEEPQPCCENLSMDNSPCCGFPCMENPCVDNRSIMNNVSMSNDVVSGVVASAIEVTAPQAARPTKPVSKKAGVPKAPPPAEIALVRSITNRYPDKALWEQIVSAVSGKSAEDIRACYTAWVARGFNPTNYAWLLEWVPNGIPTLPGRNGRNGHAIPAGLPAPEMVWGTVQAEIDRVHYFGTPNLPQPIMAAIEAVGGWYAVCKCDPGGSIPARLRDAYRSAIGA